MPGKIIRQTATGLGKLVQDTAAEMVHQVGEATGLKSPPVQPKTPAARGVESQKKGDQEELARLRRQLKGEAKAAPSAGRNVEKEIAAVREKKAAREEQQQEEEKRLREMVKRQKEQEEKAAAQDAAELLPPSKRSRGLPPWVQRGTKETGQRRAV